MEIRVSRMDRKKMRERKFFKKRLRWPARMLKNWKHFDNDLIKN